MQPWVASAELTNGGTLVRPEIVPDDEHLAPQVAQQVTQECPDQFAVDGSFVDPVDQVEAAPNRTDRQSRYHRQVPPPDFVIQNRGLPPLRPGATHNRGHLEAGFVYEDEVGAQPFGLFFTRCQSAWRHCWIRASSRCRARRCGVWQLQPKACIRRPTWSR